MERQRPPALWAISDVHGARDRLRELLQAAGIIGSHDAWIGGTSTGIFLGDYVNRGEHGAAVVEFVRHLSRVAPAAGGRIITLLGNHDVLMYGVLTERLHAPYGEFASRWLLNGGRFLDLEALERDATARDWFADLPTMALVGDVLCVHADTTAYLELGASIDEVNAAVWSVLRSQNLERIAGLFEQLCRRRELGDVAALETMLRTFGGQRVVHGHTPLFGTQPESAHGGRRVNIDGGMWESDEHEPLGFIFPLA